MLRPISNQENFPQKENFVKFDWPTQIFRRKKNFEVENFQLLTMIFSENFLSVEIFLEWKWAAFIRIHAKQYHEFYGRYHGLRTTSHCDWLIWFISGYPRST